MGAPQGNRFWEQRSSHGRNPIFENSEQLWEACVEYFEWVESNPLKQGELVKYQGKAKLQELPKMRAMTISGLCIFLGISRDTWSQYRDKDGFSDITDQVDEIIRTQKFEGAAADLLNANIIARDLGLKEQSQTDITSAGQPLTPVYIGVDSDGKRKS